MTAMPVVKWVGGKTKLLGELRARVPSTYRRYFEPFIGGGALFFALEPARAVLGDSNSDLIWMYRDVVRNVDVVIDCLKGHREAYLDPARREGYYYSVRTSWNEGLWKRGTPAAAAAFIFLNKTCFNGLWRVNKKGEFNVPEGDYKNPTIFDVDALRAASAALKKADLQFGSFEETSQDAGDGDFVYFDPPYDPLSKTSNFTAYTKDKFGDEAQEKLALHAQELHMRGAKVMLSNNDTPLIRQLYKGFQFSNVKCARPINSKADKRGEIDEVIITSWRV